MAVVLNDLLGISTPNRTRRGDESSEQFPSYDEFWASRSDMGVPRTDDYGYDDGGTSQRHLRDSYSDQPRSRNQFAQQNNNEYYQPRENRNQYDYAQQNRVEDFSSQNSTERFSYSAPQNSFQTREYENEYYGSKRVSSSPRSENFHDYVQAHTRKEDFNSCLYSVRDELSNVSDAQYEDALFDRLSFVSPLANSQQMRRSTRKVAAKPIARKTKKASRLTFKGKVILAVYVALAVLITTLIAVNAAGFNGVSHSASAGDNVSYAETATEVETQANSTSAVVSNTASDVEYGYVETQFNYAKNTNWFDRFCDNIGKMFE